MRYDIHLKLVNDCFKCDSACVSWLEFCIYFNFYRFRALAYTILDKLWVVFLLPATFAQRKALIFKLLRSRFWGFSPAGATRCTDRGEKWHEGPLLCAKFHPHRCSNKGIVPQKQKFLLIFDQNVEYNRPQWRISCVIFTKFAEFVPGFRLR